MKHQILALAVAALSFTACSNEDNISQDYLADTPIKLNVSVTNPTTRAGYSNELKPDAFWLMVYHDDNKNDKYNFDIFAEKVGDTWKHMTSWNMLIIIAKPRLLCFGQI